MQGHGLGGAGQCSQAAPARFDKAKQQLKFTSMSSSWLFIAAMMAKIPPAAAMAILFASLSVRGGIW